MCGIVGIASPTPLTIPMKEFFQDLLFHDVIRGPHATGVAAIDTMDRSLCVAKKAVPAQFFLQDEEVMEDLFAFKHNYNIMIGHNRFATSGAKDADANAHPFIHGDIVGVHNGSLRNQKLLNDSEKFVVDSDNLFNHLDNHGIDDTISKTDGAYTLVWYNKEDGTLNFLRNDERPLAIGKLTNGCWVWASEMGMLQWLVKRHKTLSWATYKEGGIDYNHVHQLDPMLHMKFEFAERSRAIPTPRLVKKTEPVFPRSTSYYGWPDYDRDNANAAARLRHQQTTHTSTTYGNKIKDILAKFLVGAEVGSMLELEYMGKAEESSKTGYVAKLELFKYQSKNGKVVVFHQFQHDNSYVKEWTEKDIGKKIYGAIASVQEHNLSSYACTKNEWINHAMGITSLTTIKPNRFWPYCDEGDVVADIKKEGESNVLPFREAVQTGTKDGSQGSKGQLVLSPNVVATKDEFMQQKVLLANGFMTQAIFIEAMTLNGVRCAECARTLSATPPSKIWLYSHFDRDDGGTHDYLHCSRRCYIQNKEECDMIDQDYDKRYGGQDD